VSNQYGLEGEYVVAASCSDVTKLDFHTNETIWACADRLASAHLPKTDFENLEKAFGLNYHPEGLLHDHTLREYVKPAQHTMYDFMHVWLVSGVAHMEIFEFLQRLRPFGVGYPQIDSYIRVWHWPKYVTNPPTAAFNEARASSSSEAFKAGASEILSLYPVLRHIIEVVVQPRGILQNEIKSILALFRVLDGFAAVAHKRVRFDHLQTAISDHMKRFAEAYPDQLMKPKHHFGLHVPEQVKTRGRLWSCFVLERKHKELKRYATNTTLLKSMEESVTKDILNAQLRHAEYADFDIGPHLIQPIRDDGSLAHHFGFAPELLVSKAAYTGLGKISCEDIVLYRTDAAELQIGAVRVHVQVGVQLHTILEMYGKHPEMSHVWCKRDVFCVVHLKQLCAPCIWTQVQCGIRVLTPSAWAW